MKKQLKNVLLPTMHVLWKAILPHLLAILKELTLRSYNFFKENTEEKIKETYENLERFEEDYNKTPTETDTITIIK